MSAFNLSPEYLHCWRLREKSFWDKWETNTLAIWVTNTASTVLKNPVEAEDIEGSTVVNEEYGVGAYGSECKCPFWQTPVAEDPILTYSEFQKNVSQQDHPENCTNIILFPLFKKNHGLLSRSNMFDDEWPWWWPSNEWGGVIGGDRVSAIVYSSFWYTNRIGQAFVKLDVKVIHDLMTRDCTLIIYPTVQFHASITLLPHLFFPAPSLKIPLKK